MAQGLLLEGLVAHLGGPERYLEAGAALRLQRPPQYPEAGAEVGGAGAGGGGKQGEDGDPCLPGPGPHFPPGPCPVHPGPHQVLRGSGLVVQNRTQPWGRLLCSHLWGQSKQIRDKQGRIPELEALSPKWEPGRKWGSFSGWSHRRRHRFVRGAWGKRP